MAIGKKGAARIIKQTENQVRALQMRRDGRTLRDIGDELGVSYETVRRWVNNALAEMAKEISGNADAIRMLEGHRLLKGLKRTMDEIDESEKYPDKAITNLVRLSESYRKLFGLDAPQRVDVTARMDESEVRERIISVLGLARD